MDLQFRFRESAFKHNVTEGIFVMLLKIIELSGSSKTVNWDEYITQNTVHLGPDLVKLGVKPGFAHNYLALNEIKKEKCQQGC